MNSRYVERFSTAPFQDYDNLRQSVRLSKLYSEPKTNGLAAQPSTDYCTLEQVSLSMNEISAPFFVFTRIFSETVSHLSGYA